MQSAESIVGSNPKVWLERQVAPLSGTLYRQAVRMTRHHADAEDLV